MKDGIFNHICCTLTVAVVFAVFLVVVLTDSAKASTQWDECRYEDGAIVCEPAEGVEPIDWTGFKVDLCEDKYLSAGIHANLEGFRKCVED